MPTCTATRSWHHHQPATVVLKTRPLNMNCLDARFCRQQDKMCDQQQSSYTPNSTAARRNWRRWPLSSCRLDSECSSDGEEEERKASHALVKPLRGRVRDRVLPSTCVPITRLVCPAMAHGAFSLCPPVCLCLCLSVCLSVR